MPVVPTGEILAAAYRERYGVAAINVVNDLTMEAVLAAAEIYGAIGREVAARGEQAWDRRVSTSAISPGKSPRALQRSTWNARVSCRGTFSTTHSSGVLETRPPSQ